MMECHIRFGDFSISSRRSVFAAKVRRIAKVHNGSSLFTGDAGQGESNIRRWILENDLLEAIVALPLNMFYNTGIATYIWVLSNRKAKHGHGKVQLIDATRGARNDGEPVLRLGRARKNQTDEREAGTPILRCDCVERGVNSRMRRYEVNPSELRSRR